MGPKLSYLTVAVTRFTFQASKASSSSAQALKGGKTEEMAGNDPDVISMTSLFGNLQRKDSTPLALPKLRQTLESSPKSWIVIASVSVKCFFFISFFRPRLSGNHIFRRKTFVVYQHHYTLIWADETGKGEDWEKFLMSCLSATTEIGTPSHGKHN